jgi:hypothetical protein
MIKKCKYSTFYKALKPPTCDCEYCWKKWEEAKKYKKKKQKELISEDCPDPESCEGGCIGYCSGEEDDSTEDVVDYIRRHGG